MQAGPASQAPQEPEPAPPGPVGEQQRQQGEEAPATTQPPAPPASGVVYVDAAVQTVERAEAGVQYEAPGAAVAPAGEELQQLLASHELAAFLRRAVPVAEQALQQNKLADTLRDEFAGLAEEDTQEGGSGAAALTDKVAVHQSFTDLVHCKGRALAAVQWHPVRRGVMAVACVEPLNLSERAARGAGGVQQAAPAILLWNYRDPIHPEAVLQAPADVLAFAFNPAQPQWVAAGCLGGQVALWNLDNLQQQREQAARLQLGGGAGSRRSTAEPGAGAEGSTEPAAFVRANVLQPAHVSLLDASHQATVTELLWLPGLAATRDGRLEPAASPTECNLFATAAMDGKLMVWDMRITSGGRRRARATATEDDVVEWKPALTLPVQSTTSQPLSCTPLALDPKPSSTTRFMAGSLEGDMAVVDSNIRQVDTNRTHNAVAHAASSCGRVRALAFSPFFDDLLLAVADCGFLVWRDGGECGLGQQPLLESRFSEVFYTTGCWSPTKPGVVLLGRLDGKLEIWDLLDRIHAPVVVAPVSPAAVLGLAFSPGPSGSASRSATHQVLAVADATGVLHVVDLPRTLRRRSPGEVRAMATLAEREQARLVYVAERQAVREKLRKELEPKRRASIQFASGASKPPPPPQQAEADAAAEAERAAEAAYLKLEEEWRAKLGLPPLVVSASARALSATASTLAVSAK